MGWEVLSLAYLSGPPFINCNLLSKTLKIPKTMSKRSNEDGDSARNSSQGRKPSQLEGSAEV
jgi:hypothetical protein